MNILHLPLFLCLIASAASCHSMPTKQISPRPPVKLGVEVLFEKQLDLIRGKHVGLITNPTGLDAKLDSIMHSPVEMTIKSDGKWRLDFEGASRWGWHTFNAHHVAFTSGLWVAMCQTLVPTQRINDGAYLATELHMPKGTWCNPDDRRTGHAYAWHFLVSGWSALWRGLSQAYFSRGYLEETKLFEGCARISIVIVCWCFQKSPKSKFEPFCFVFDNDD